MFENGIFVLSMGNTVSGIEIALIKPLFSLILCIYFFSQSREFNFYTEEKSFIFYYFYIKQPPD